MPFTRATSAALAELDAGSLWLFGTFLVLDPLDDTPPETYFESDESEPVRAIELLVTLQSGSGIRTPTLKFEERLLGGMTEDAMLGRGARRWGAERSYPRPLCDLAELRRLHSKATRDHPGARTLADRLVTLPTHSGTREGERGEVVRALREG